jgi:CheY-like chemotaxis protein
VRLFEPFERGPAADRIAGLGLGLSIARRLAQAMGGGLTAHSAVDEGTSFRLALDLPLSAGHSAEPARPGRGGRVLLAEDTPLSRRVLAALLRAEGALVEEAEDGDQALSLAARLDFDLMILDMRMPGRDGLDVAQAVRGGLGRNRETPVAIVTASNSEAILRRANELGIKSVLQKPVGRSGLRRLLISAESGQWTHVAEIRGAADAVPERLAELRSVLGEDEADSMLIQVQPNILAAVERIGTAYRVGDRPTAIREAHRLAGLAGHFGLTAVSNAARALESGLENGLADADSWARIGALRDAVRNNDWDPFCKRQSDQLLRD